MSSLMFKYQRDQTFSDHQCFITLGGSRAVYVVECDYVHCKFIQSFETEDEAIDAKEEHETEGTGRIY